MTEPILEDNKDLPEPTTNWRRVYLLVIAFFVAFCLFMYIFSQYTTA